MSQLRNVIFYLLTIANTCFQGFLPSSAICLLPAGTGFSYCGDFSALYDTTETTRDCGRDGEGAA